MEVFFEFVDRVYEVCRKDYCFMFIDFEVIFCRYLEGFVDLCVKRGKILYWRYCVLLCKKSKFFVC